MKDVYVVHIMKCVFNVMLADLLSFLFCQPRRVSPFVRLFYFANVFPVLFSYTTYTGT